MNDQEYKHMRSMLIRTIGEVYEVPLKEAAGMLFELVERETKKGLSKDQKKKWMEKHGHENPYYNWVDDPYY